MKLKQQPGDFRVVELLREGALEGTGPHRVYRVVKSKRTTFEVVDALAKAAGVDKRRVSVAGLKDRQGITVQHVSVEGGPRLRIDEPGLSIEFLADAERPIESEAVRANGFEIVVRELTRADLDRQRDALASVRDDGVPNYFDDQRFGALRHGQGFLVREMIDGKLESALMRCLLAPSPFDPPREAAFKGRLRRAWGDFDLCEKLCRGGNHLSVFRHLAEHPTDFAGAFRFVATRLRLIHLYAYQSFLWNSAVSAYLRERIPAEDRFLIPTDAGAVVAFTRLTPAVATDFRDRTFPLLAPDVRIDDEGVRRAVAAALAQERLTLEQLRVPAGVEGFAFKAEDRPLLVVPRHLRVRHASRDELNPGFAKVELRFELPRGSYATLVVKRLFTPHDIPRPMRERRPDLRVSGAQPPLHAERPRRDRPAPVARAPRSGPRPFPRSSGLDGPRRFPPRPGAPRRPFGDGPRARRPFAPRPPRPPRLPRPDERPPDPPKEPDEKNG